MIKEYSPWFNNYLRNDFPKVIFINQFSFNLHFTKQKNDLSETKRKYEVSNFNSQIGFFNINTSLISLSTKRVYLNLSIIQL